MQHAIVAVVAIAITLLAVRWYVPQREEIAGLRSERDQLQASIKDLKQRGGRIATRECGPQKRLCVQVDKAAGTFGTDANQDVFMVAKGY